MLIWLQEYQRAMGPLKQKTVTNNNNNNNNSNHYYYYANICDLDP